MVNIECQRRHWNNRHNEYKNIKFSSTDQNDSGHGYCQDQVSSMSIFNSK